MKFPIRITTRARWEHLKRSEAAARLKSNLERLQASEEASDSILNSDALAVLRQHPGFTVIDIGANRGDWARAFLKLFPQATIYAVEPDPDTFSILAKNLAKHGNVHPVNLAVHSQPGRMPFYSHKNSVLSSLIKLPEAEGGAARTIEVETMTLDGLVESRHLSDVCIVKIDTEGNDLAVLAGAQKTLSALNLQFVIVEFGIGPADQRHVLLNDLIRILAQNGFAMKLVGGWGLDDCKVYANALFCKETVNRKLQE